MQTDIVNLRQFYSSRLGRKVRARLRRRVHHYWPLPAEETVLGIGYALPVLPETVRGEGCSIALMPASQGAIYWPIEGANRSLLADPLRPPFGVNTLPRILLLHALEHSEQAEELLRVQWQLLQPGGKLLLIVPNRHGLWANFGHTPFTSGRAYGLAELKALLAETDFTLCDVTSALFAPPSERGFWLKLSRVFEWVGSIICPRHGGLLVIEAEKQIYAAVGERIRKPVAWASQQGAPA